MPLLPVVSNRLTIYPSIYLAIFFSQLVSRFGHIELFERLKSERENTLNPLIEQKTSNWDDVWGLERVFLMYIRRRYSIGWSGNQTANCRWWNAHLRTSFCINMDGKSEEKRHRQWSHSKRISINFRFVFVMFLVCFVIFPKDKPQNEWWHWPRIPFFSIPAITVCSNGV